jgi:hypothetical protein
LFWALCGLAAIGAALFAKIQFHQAFPILDQPLTMDRAAATAEARRLASAQGWSPADAKDATRFWHNADLTTFIELEAGGKANLHQLLGQGRITPYRWQIRLYRAKDAAETLVEFSPDGRFLGFSEKLPETQSAPELAQEAARSLAEMKAAALGQTLLGYTLVEAKSNRVVSGRLDWSFTYERAEPLLGAGRDQIGLAVRGDRFCGIACGVKLPDEFFRRYTAMRASNTNLQLTANSAFLLLICLGGCGGGLIYLARSRKIDWRGAYLPVGLLVLGSLAASINQLPLAWFGYDTALSPGEFQTKTLLGIGLGSLGLTIFILMLAAAEGLSREAFPNHPRLWAAPSRRAAGSREVVGAVLGGYVGAALFLAYAVAMARFGSERLGWWMPSSTLVDPSLLGSSAPWIAPVFNSFMAGLTEECLFRAVPLAGAVLLGRRFGRIRLWVGAVLVLQALVFGAAHSNYPTMPGWARMVELFIPSLCFGALYLRFGLIPGILIHFLYDLVWMGLPVFAARESGAGLSCAILGAFALAPLVWVVFCRLRAGAGHELPADLRNAGWVRPAKPAVAQTPPPLPVATPVPVAATPAVLRGVFVAGLLSLVAWGISLAREVPTMPGLSQRKDTAIAQARATLAAEGHSLGDDWEVLPLAHSDSDNERLFVWETAGETVFHKLSGNALAVPGWRIRFVRSRLPLPDRAEEYHIFLTGDGRVQRYAHILPESRPGARLPQAEAQALAERELRRIYGVETSALALVSANESKQPARSDWRFIWKDPRAGLEQGEARYWIMLAGDALGGYERHVFIPEEWTRAQASGNNARGIVNTLANIALGLALVAALIASVATFRKHPFGWRAALGIAGIVMAAFAVQFVVKLPSRLAWLSTNESFQVQTIRLAVGAVVGLVVILCFLGAMAGMGTGKKATPASAAPELLAGLGAGFLLLAGERLVSCLEPSHPWHAGIDGANSGIPYLGSLWMISMLIPISLFWIRVHCALPARPMLRLAFTVLLGLCYGASFESGFWTPIILRSVLYGVAFVLLDRLVKRLHPAALVAVVATRFLGQAGAALFLPGHPDAWLESLVALALVVIAGMALYRLLRSVPCAAPVAATATTETDNTPPVLSGTLS